MKRFTSIRSILLFAFTLSLTIPALIMLLYAHQITSRTLADQALERQLHEVTLQAQHVEQSLAQIRQDIAYLARLRSLQQLRISSGSLENVQQDLMVFAIANPMIHRLIIVQDDNRIGLDNSTNTSRTIDGDVMQNGDYDALILSYQALETGQLIVSFDLVWDTPVVRYSLGTDNGLLIIDVLASWVLRDMPDVQNNRIWAILNQDVQHLLFPLQSEDYIGAIPATDDALSQYLTEFQQGDSGTVDIQSNTFIYSRIYPTHNTQQYWLLYEQMPQSDLYAVVNDFYRSSALILLLAIVTMLGISGAVAGQLIRPLQELQGNVRQFAVGRTLSKKSKFFKITELNELHQSFYQMATQLDSERQQKRELIKQLISAQEDERKRIAYDLHDGLIQQLVVAKMYTAMLKDDLDDSARLTIQQSEDALKSAIVEGRRIIEGLHPTILDDLGLVDAIAELAHQQAKRYGWQLNLQLETLPYVPHKTVEITVFRIVQEALNNVGKHAKATHVSIQLKNGNGVNLYIVDNGQGFDKHADDFTTGLGIGTMRERTTSLDGSFQIESLPQHGTTISISLPYA